MKRNIPSISIVQDKTKKRSDDLIPLFIHINWKGTRCKESTGIYLTEKDYKKGLYKTNRQLKKRLNEIDDQISILLSTREDFTAKDCLGKTISKLRPEILLYDMVSVKKLEDNTVRGYKTTIKSLKSYFGDDLVLDELTLHNIQGWARTTKVSPSTMCSYLKKLNGLLQYGYDTNKLKENVMEKWKFKQDGYKQREQPRARSKADVTHIIHVWENETGYIKECAGIWLSGLYFCGLALCDLIEVDWDNIQEKIVDGHVYYHTYTNRNKTKEIATILTPKYGLTSDLLDFLRTKPWTRYSKYSEHINRGLKKIFEDLTYYQARHTFCSMLVSSNISLNDVSTLMGRSVNGISAYIQQVTKVEHLSKAVDNMKNIEIFDIPEDF